MLSFQNVKYENKISKLDRFGTQCLFNEDEMKELHHQFRLMTRNKNNITKPNSRVVAQGAMNTSKVLVDQFIDVYAREVGVFENCLILRRLFSLIEVSICQ